MGVILGSILARFHVSRGDLHREALAELDEDATWCIVCMVYQAYCVIAS
jgi:hypothetical protein